MELNLTEFEKNDAPKTNKPSWDIAEKMLKTSNGLEIDKLAILSLETKHWI